MTHHGINLISSAPHTTLSPTFYRDSNLSLSLDNQSPFSISVKQRNNFLLRSPSLCYRSYTFTGNVFERVKFLDLSPSPSAFLPAVVSDRPLREMQNWRSASDGNHPLSSSQRDVTYRCGSCGYELNLSSSGRNTSTIGSKYGKSIKRGIISFFYIDENRFTQVEELQCMPYISKRSWGLFRRRTKLLCRKCENLIGTAYDNPMPSYQFVSDGSDSASGSEISSHRKYDVRIRALQPSSSEEVGVPLAL